MKPASRLRAAPVLLFGLVAATVLGNAPSGEKPVRWTVRNTDAWMAEWDGVRDVRLAASAESLRRAASVTPVMVETVPVSGRPMVVADAGDRPPRDVPKQVPDAAPEPEITGAVPAAPADAGSALPGAPRPHPTINRTGKTDRLFSPTPLGRSTEREIFTRPTLAVVPPALDAWPPLTTIASLTAPQTDKTLPRVAITAPTGDRPDPIVVAMVRSGPGRVVTSSVVAGLTTGGKAGHGRVLLPPVPESQTASLPPRSRVWAQPDVPAIGYAGTNDVEYRFRSLLGSEETQPKAADSDETLPP